MSANPGMAMVDFQAGARATEENYLPALPASGEFFWPMRQIRAMTFQAPVSRDDMLPASLQKEARALQKNANTIQRANLRFAQRIEPNIQKIAVLRSNGIGDFIFSLPALYALRLAYPHAEIVLLGLEWHAEFLSGRASPIDRVIVVPKSRGVHDPSDFTDEDPQELDRFFTEMANEQFNVAIQLHGGGRYSNPFVKRLGANLTVGLRSPDAIPLDRWVPYVFFQMEILRYLEVVSLLGANLANLEPIIAVTDEDLAESLHFVPETLQPLVVLHPGAGDPRRRWPVEKFAAVGNALAWAGAHVAVVGIEPDCDLVDSVVNLMSAEAQNLCGCLRLGGLAGLLSRASVVVSNDSGPLHLANAVGASTVGIYWCGNMITAGPVTRTCHRTAISWRLNCPVCGLNCTRTACEHAVSYVADVPQEEISTLALELAGLDERPIRAPLLAMF